MPTPGTDRVRSALHGALPATASRAYRAKLKNDFSEKMSREVRTPLNSIIEAIISVLAGGTLVASTTAQYQLCVRRHPDERLPRALHAHSSEGNTTRTDFVNALGESTLRSRL